LGVTVNFGLALFGCTTLLVAAADYTTIAVADSGAQTSKHFSVVVSPAPDATAHV
jgi:hypothetical protein